MWRIWLLFDPRRVLIALAVFLFTMAIIMHFIMLSTERFNFLGGASDDVTASLTIESDRSALI